MENLDNIGMLIGMSIVMICILCFYLIFWIGPIYQEFGSYPSSSVESESGHAGAQMEQTHNSDDEYWPNVHINATSSSSLDQHFSHSNSNGTTNSSYNSHGTGTPGIPNSCICPSANNNNARQVAACCPVHRNRGGNGRNCYTVAVVNEKCVGESLYEDLPPPYELFEPPKYDSRY